MDLCVDPKRLVSVCMVRRRIASETEIAVWVCANVFGSHHMKQLLPKSITRFQKARYFLGLQMRESWQFLLVPNSFQNDLILKGVWSGGFIAYLPRQESLVSAKVSACRFHQNFRVTSFTIATLLPGARSPVLQARPRLM